MSKHPPPQHLHIAVPSRLRALKQRTPQPVKDLARNATRGYGLLTAGRRTVPDFLIVGTKRGGTTSLWNAMVGHPDVLPMFPASREIKSPRYFTLNYAKGPRWYRSHFPTDRQRMTHHRQRGVWPQCGESDPYYMFHPLAPQRIAADLPDVKVIVSLRDPVKRAWSHYRERMGGGTEALGFREALHAEEARLAGERERLIADPTYDSFRFNYNSYLARGRYVEQLPVLMELFGDRLLILRAEDFYSDPRAELDTLAEFLGLPAFPEQQIVKRYNEMPKASIPQQDEDFLRDYYQPYNRALEVLLNRPMNWR